MSIKLNPTPRHDAEAFAAREAKAHLMHMHAMRKLEVSCLTANLVDIGPTVDESARDWQERMLARIATRRAEVIDQYPVENVTFDACGAPIVSVS